MRPARSPGRQVVADRLADERGQAIPLILALVVLVLAGGVIVFWLGYSTTLSTRAQTAADAAALAGEKELVTELETPRVGLNGDYLPPTFSAATVCGQASDYAGHNRGHIVSCDPVPDQASTIGWDVQVKVQGNDALPKDSPGAGSAATASARASVDPFAQASPTIETQATACEASLGTGTPFAPHGGTIGFFAASGTNYSYGCESRVAGALDRLAIAEHLRLTGTSGYVSATATGTSDPTAAAHSCGAASSTQGLAHVSDSVLAQYGLTRPFKDKPDVVELTGGGCGVGTSVDATATASVSLGNLNVHLVPLTGGPEGSLLGLVGIGSSPIGESQIQVGCQIYKAWQTLNLSGADGQKVLLISLMVASDESDFGQNIGANRTDPSQSIGVFQQISDDGWGTIPEELDVTSAALMFFTGGHNDMGAGAQGLMTYYEQDPGAPTWVLAQETQGSGAGASSDGYDNYGQHIGDAQAMLAKIGGGACK